MATLTTEEKKKEHLTENDIALRPFSLTYGTTGAGENESKVEVGIALNIISDIIKNRRKCNDLIINIEKLHVRRALENISRYYGYLEKKMYFFWSAWPVGKLTAAAPGFRQPEATPWQLSSVPFFPSDFAGERMKMPIQLTSQAYCKMLLHAAKYPHYAVNGLLVAEKTKEKKKDRDHSEPILCVDCVPLFHGTLALAPMLEVALTMVRVVYILYSRLLAPLTQDSIRLYITELITSKFTFGN